MAIIFDSSNKLETHEVHLDPDFNIHVNYDRNIYRKFKD